MKINLLLFCCITLSTAAFSQTKSFVLTGGWSSVLPTDGNSSVNGYKISGQWEKSVIQDHWGMGVSFSYIHFKEVGTSTSSNTTDKFKSMPLTFYGKYMVGNDKIQGYAKLGAGLQYTIVSKESPSLYVSDQAIGLAAGTGVGGYYSFTEYLSLVLDYELLYLANNEYRSGIVNTVSLGVVFKFDNY